MSFEVTADTVPRLVRDVVRYSDMPCTIAAETAEEFRAVLLDPVAGRAVYTRGQENMPPAARDEVLVDLTDVLVRHAPVAVYGRLRRHSYRWLTALENDLPMELWPPWEERPGHANLRLLSERGLVHDAFGLHLLDLARFDLPRLAAGEWEVTPILPDHVVVRGVAAEEWFGSEQPPVDTVIRARRSLRPLAMRD